MDFAVIGDGYALRGTFLKFLEARLRPKAGALGVGELRSGDDGQRG